MLIQKRPLAGSHVSVADDALVNHAPFDLRTLEGMAWVRAYHPALRSVLVGSNNTLQLFPALTKPTITHTPTFDMRKRGQKYLDVGASPARRTVLAPPISSKEDECTYDTMQSIPDKPAPIYSQAISVGTNKNDFLLGLAGTISVAAILGLSIYSVVKYLL